MPKKQSNQWEIAASRIRHIGQLLASSDQEKVLEGKRLYAKAPAYIQRLALEYSIHYPIMEGINANNGC